MGDHSDIDHTGITGVGVGDANAHIADATDAHDASAVGFDDTGLSITAADVQAMGAALDAAIGAGGIPATIFDAKGDLIAASAADTAARLAAGTNGGILQTASGETTGLIWTPRPEFQAFGAAGTPIDFTAPTLDTGVTDAAVAGYQRRLMFPANGSTFADVASAIGTGDFDVRARVTHVNVLNSVSNLALVSLLFALTDTSRTASTKLCIKTYGNQPGAAAPYTVAQVGASEAGAVVRPTRFPLWMRMTRSGTSVTYYCSFSEEASWITLHTATSSLDIAKIGFIGTTNVASVTMEAFIHQVKSI